MLIYRCELPGGYGVFRSACDLQAIRHPSIYKDKLLRKGKHGHIDYFVSHIRFGCESLEILHEWFDLDKEILIEKEAYVAVYNVPPIHVTRYVMQCTFNFNHAVLEDLISAEDFFAQFSVKEAA